MGSVQSYANFPKPREYDYYDLRAVIDEWKPKLLALYDQIFTDAYDNLTIFDVNVFEQILQDGQSIVDSINEWIGLADNAEIADAKNERISKRERNLIQTSPERIMAQGRQWIATYQRLKKKEVHRELNVLPPLYHEGGEEFFPGGTTYRLAKVHYDTKVAQRKAARQKNNSRRKRRRMYY